MFTIGGLDAPFGLYGVSVGDLWRAVCCCTKAEAEWHMNREGLVGKSGGRCEANLKH